MATITTSSLLAVMFAVLACLEYACGQCGVCEEWQFCDEGTEICASCASICKPHAILDAMQYCLEQCPGYIFPTTEIPITTAATSEMVNEGGLTNLTIMCIVFGVLLLISLMVIVFCICMCQNEKVMKWFKSGSWKFWERYTKPVQAQSGEDPRETARALIYQPGYAGGAAGVPV